MKEDKYFEKAEELREKCLFSDALLFYEKALKDASDPDLKLQCHRRIGG